MNKLYENINRTSLDVEIKKIQPEHGVYTIKNLNSSIANQMLRKLKDNYYVISVLTKEEIESKWYLCFNI